MRRAVFACTAMVVLWPLAGPVVAEIAVSKPMGISAQPAAKDKPARPRDEELRALLDGLARQIHEIDANIANLGPNNATAQRFRAVSLAAYRRLGRADPRPGRLRRHGGSRGGRSAEGATAMTRRGHGGIAAIARLLAASGMVPAASALSAGEGR